MNPIHSLTNRLGDKGTLILIGVVVLATFAVLDYRHIMAPSPKVTLLEEAWQFYDRAALSRDAPDAAFDHVNDPFVIKFRRLESLTDRAPSLSLDAAQRQRNLATEEAFHTGLTDLRECTAWLTTYRGITDPVPAKDNARDHIDACTTVHPLKSDHVGRTLTDQDP